MDYGTRLGVVEMSEESSLQVSSLDKSDPFECFLSHIVW
jgi:hypothetical protein